MAEKYEIFIHSDQRSSIANKTQPQEEQLGGAFSVKDVYKGVSSFATSGFNGAVNTGVAALSKVAPWIAVAVAVAKITDYVVSTGFQHEEEYTGYYQNNLAYNNFKTGLSLAMNPVKTMTNYVHITKQIQKTNMAREQQRTIIGNTFINKGKVGV